MVKLFGWEIRRPSDDENEQPSFAPKIEEDGATIVTSAGGFYGTYVDLQGTIRTESELVSRYREMSLQPEIEEALEDIINEAMDTDDNQIVTINLDKLKYSESVKKQIRNEFDNVLNLLNFNQLSYEIFRRWYIDGRLYFHVIIDAEKPGAGIKELRYLDPRKIKKIREVVKVREGEITVTKTKNEYYMYNDYGFTPSPNATRSSVDVSSSQSSSGIKIAKDAIIYVTSGIMDQNNTMVLSYLHKAIRPLNMLRSLEDANVIYVLSRAPERRIFYIDVGSLPKAKAEQYVRDMMTKHKNRLVYDANTGEITTDRKYMTMLEDYWLPRREGSRGTEITNLPGSGSLMQNDTIEYFQNKLYRSLNIPITRLQAEGGFSLGRASEVSRDEVKFGKFIGRLRRRFSHLFYQALERQLILKKITIPKEWEKIKSELFFEYAIDNYFSELKYNEILVGRLDTLSRLESYIGKYYSDRWVRKNILMQTDEDITSMDKEIQGEGGESDNNFGEIPDDKDSLTTKQNDQSKNIMLNDSKRFNK